MINNHSIGNAGEFHVLAQLVQRGYIAAKTDEGQTLVDVICTDPTTMQSVNIQVKSTTGKGVWLLSPKNEKHYAGLWYVLVELGDPDTLPSFYVFHSSEISLWLQADHQSRLDKPQRNSEDRKNRSMRRFRPTAEQLAAAKGNWSALFA